jgi:hypothetical protein
MGAFKMNNNEIISESVQLLNKLIAEKETQIEKMKEARERLLEVNRWKSS